MNDLSHLDKDGNKFKMHCYILTVTICMVVSALKLDLALFCTV